MTSNADDAPKEPTTQAVGTLASIEDLPIAERAEAFGVELESLRAILDGTRDDA